MGGRSDSSAAVFGAFDGVTSALGLVAGLIATGATAHTILIAAAGLAVASAAGMAFGDYLAGSRPHTAAVMGGATLVGSLAPAVPVAVWPGAAGVAVALLLVGAVAGVIAAYRSAEAGVGRALLSTVLTLAVASGLSIAVSLLLGVAG